MRRSLWFHLRQGWSAGLVCFAALATSVAASTNLPVAELLRGARPLVIAHRGYSAIAPENTTIAFERALAAGADLIELDYHHTRDGHLVVLHDDTLDRTTDATNRWGGSRIQVSEQHLDRLRALQAGLWFKPPHPQVALPTLEEALAVIQPRGITLIERKAGEAAACAKLLRERGLINRVVVQAFDWDYLRDFRRIEPQQVLGALGPPSTRQGKKLNEFEKPLGPDWLDEIKSFGGQIAVWNKLVDAAAVKAAHERGLKVWVYTINDEATARLLLRAGVDGIITDNPALIWKALATR
jgi:glycerophosphoryl diester phosphodiesterase